MKENNQNLWKEIIKKTISYLQTKSGTIEFCGDFERDTIWGNLNQIAELFGRNKSVISRHINNVFKSGELKPGSVVTKIATTITDGKIFLFWPQKPNRRAFRVKVLKNDKIIQDKK